MKRSLIGALAGALVALGLSGAAAAAPSEQDTTWMVAAHQSNLTEIAAGNAALRSSSDETVRALGQMFIDMHTKLDADLTAAATQLGVTLPGSPSPEQQQTLAEVEAQQGEAFDAAWIASQIAGHRTTLQATQQETAAGSDPTVIGLAQAATPVVQQHLTALEAAAAAAGAPTLVQTGDGGLLDSSDTSGAPWRWALAAIGGLLFAAGSVTVAVRHRRG